MHDASRALRIGDELRHHVSFLHSSWPTEEDRRNDLSRNSFSAPFLLTSMEALVPVISPEDLIVTKILAGRPKDIEDIRGVINERRVSLDVARIRAVLRILERALGQSDLLPVFEREWRERKRDRTAAARPATEENRGPSRKRSHDDAPACHAGVVRVQAPSAPPPLLCHHPR